MRKVVSIMVKLFILVVAVSLVGLTYTAMARHNSDTVQEITVQPVITTPVMPVVSQTTVACVPTISAPILSDHVVDEQPVVETTSTTKKHHKYAGTVVPTK